MSENETKSPARPRRGAAAAETEKQEPVVKSVSKSPSRKSSTPAKKASAKKVSVKKVATLSVDFKDAATLQRENSELVLTNKELEKKVEALQEQVTELSGLIKSMKQSKSSRVSGTVKGFNAVAAQTSDEEDEPVKTAPKFSRKAKAAVSPSPKKLAKTVVSSASTDFLAVTPWKHVLKEHYANSAMMAPKLKLEFRDAMQSFLEDNLGRKAEIKCRFIDDAGHVDIGIPENLIEKFVVYFNERVNAPKKTRAKKLEEILKSGGSLTKRRLTVTSATEESPVRRKNVKLVSA